MLQIFMMTNIMVICSMRMIILYKFRNITYTFDIIDEYTNPSCLDLSLDDHNAINKHLMQELLLTGTRRDMTID